MKTAIEARNITKCYLLDGVCAVQVLKGISLKIKQGEFVSIMGPSGSGKSTLLHILGCLDQPTTGDLFIQGENVAPMNENEFADVRRNEVGFVFQSFFLIPHLTTLGNVELPLRISEIEDEERSTRAKELLESVGLGHRLDHLPQQLSGGERQRVAIARALSNNPSILMADEPTGNLDSKSGKELMSILKKFAEIGKTIIMVTHDMEIAHYSERIIRIKDGIIENEVKV